MNEIISPIKNELEAFEIKLNEVITSCDNFLIDSLKTFMFANPKRLRPILIFLFAKILKLESALIQDIALITELIHSASLIHDDIIDEESLRRNNPTFFEKFGSKLAVLEGDLLLSLALEKISQTTLDISKIFASKIKNTINGEIAQNEHLAQVPNLDLYLNKTFNKTGNLFFAGLESLYTIKNISANTKEALSSFLKNYVLAFQIKNDIDNFKKDFSDYKNGNYTLPVIYFFIENHTAEFNQKNTDFEKYINKSIEKVKNLKQNALKSLFEIENSIYKESLIKLTNYTL